MEITGHKVTFWSDLKRGIGNQLERWSESSRERQKARREFYMTHGWPPAVNHAGPGGFSLVVATTIATAGLVVATTIATAGLIVIGVVVAIGIEGPMEWVAAYEQLRTGS